MQSFEHFEVISVVDKSIHVVVILFFTIVLQISIRPFSFTFLGKSRAREREKQIAPLASFLNATIAFDQYAREKSLSTTWVPEHHLH